METIKLSRKRFKEKFKGLGEDLGAVTAFDEGEEPIVYIPGRASTKQRLHEIFHATRSLMAREVKAGKKWVTLDDLALDELRAQQFSSESIGMEGEIPWDMVLVTARGLIRYGYKPSHAMEAINKAMDKEGYEPLDREHRSDLWWLLRDEYERKRRK